VLLRAGEVADITDVESEFGSSEYAKEILGSVWGYPPELDLEKEAALQKTVIEVIQQGLADSVHDCAEGGLAVALAEKGFAKGIGARLNLASNGLPAEFVLFDEKLVVSALISELSGNYESALESALRTDTERVAA
jgi:phosphoribosylformylglycinamidine synthase